MVCSSGPVVDTAGERIASVVYCGAFIANPGHCLLDVEPPDVVERYRASAADTGDGVAANGICPSPAISPEVASNPIHPAPGR